MRSERGMSLIEASVILMTMSALAAVTAPSIRDYMTDAQQTAAKKNAETIASAVGRMLTDVGEAWVLRNAAKGASSTADTQVTPSHASTNRVDMLASGGAIPTLTAAARAPGTLTDWDDSIDNAAVQSLDNYLVLNTPSNTAANAYRTAASYDSTAAKNFDPDSGEYFNAEYAWRGAYLPGSIGADPWGNRYMVNVEFLARTINTTPSGSVKDVFVISAGANRRTDTAFELDGATPAGDDVLALISGGTR
jgi:type II secretory pathway pseudopilin PulG